MKKMRVLLLALLLAGSMTACVDTDFEEIELEKGEIKSQVATGDSDGDEGGAIPPGGN